MQTISVHQHQDVQRKAQCLVSNDPKVGIVSSFSDIDVQRKFFMRHDGYSRSKRNGNLKILQLQWQKCAFNGVQVEAQCHVQETNFQVGYRFPSLKEKESNKNLLPINKLNMLTSIISSHCFAYLNKIFLHKLLHQVPG